MATYSVYRVRFSLTNTAGKVVGGPYVAPIGISGGTRNDIHSPSVTSSLASAISSNLLAILQAQGFGGSAAPGQTVTIDSYDHALHGTPDIYV